MHLKIDLPHLTAASRRPKKAANLACMRLRKPGALLPGEGGILPEPVRSPARMQVAGARALQTLEAGGRCAGDKKHREPGIAQDAVELTKLHQELARVA
jgi:hypothetical protein